METINNLVNSVPDLSPHPEPGIPPITESSTPPATQIESPSQMGSAPTPTATLNNKRISLLSILGIILLIAATGAGGYYYGTMNSSSNNGYNINDQLAGTSAPAPAVQIESELETAPAVTEIEPSAIPQEIPAGWKTYTNPVMDFFAISYPPDALIICQEYGYEFVNMYQAPFNCPNGTDVMPLMAFYVREASAYKPYKTPATTEKVVIAGKPATKYSYVYTAEDGPLFNDGKTTSGYDIVIPVEGKVLILQLPANNPVTAKLFNEVIATLHFEK